MFFQDGQRLEVSGNSSVCAVILPSACASMLPHTFHLLLHIAAHVGWSAFPLPIMYRTARGHCNNADNVLVSGAMLDHILK